MKRIVVACGSGIATSGLVANKINNLLEERGMVGKARADSIDIKSIDLEIGMADIFVSITPTFDLSNVRIPTFSGIPFLTGIGEEEIMDLIVGLL